MADELAARRVNTCFRPWTHRDLRSDLRGLIHADERCGFSMAADPNPLPHMHLFRSSRKARR